MLPSTSGTNQLTTHKDDHINIIKNKKIPEYNYSPVTVSDINQSYASFPVENLDAIRSNELLKEEDHTLIEIHNSPKREEDCPVIGRRIINVSYFLEQCMNFPHHSLFSCASSCVKLVKEIRKGFISKFVLQCAMCKVQHIVDSDINEGKLNTNGAAILGIMNIGGGYSQLNELAGSLNMPGMSYRLYNKIETNLNEIFQNECWQSMIDAGKEEVKIAIENGNVDENCVPLITVIADGAWCKRSYRTNYNAKSGAACIVGEKTGKILFLGIRNKYCAMCVKDESKPHLCFKNWKGSSSAMESDIILEGFKRSLEMHGAKYASLIGDGDSSVYKKIMEAEPYGEFMVTKIECANHLLRNYVTKLRDIAQKRFSSQGKEVDIVLRHALKNNISRLRLSIVCAIKYRRTQNYDHGQSVQHLKKDITNSVYHVFGEHKLCDVYFCEGSKPNEKNLIPLMEKCGLLNDILASVNRLYYHSNSLIKNMTNNNAENYNSVLAKFIGGKRVDFSKKGSYEMRCNLAGLSFNKKGAFYDTIHRAITARSPGAYTKKLAQTKERRRLNNLSRKRLRFDCDSTASMMSKRKKKNSDTNVSDDEDYGENVRALDICPVEVSRMKNEFLSGLRKTEEEIAQLCAATIDQSTSNLWYTERRKRLTASYFGKICKMRPSTNPANTIKALLYSTFSGSKYTDYGKDHELTARKDFSKMIEKDVTECGFFVGKDDYCYLGASPDGLIDNDGLVEIKCPYKGRDSTPEDVILSKKINFATFVNGKFHLKRNDNFYYQVQGQLHVTERQYCFFILWTPKGLLFEKIFRDEQFFKEKMEKKLYKFYHSYYVNNLLKLQTKNLV
ncbi:uncharacterized protein LOC135129717 [Zophobas morio]|uniref:uncharacterized protein LOC135129717 n=1 Tax=Zophobas morio TaxID=2755281 RepID=UPI00308348F2